MHKRVAHTMLIHDLLKAQGAVDAGALWHRVQGWKLMLLHRSLQLRILKDTALK